MKIKNKICWKLCQNNLKVSKDNMYAKSLNKKESTKVQILQI